MSPVKADTLLTFLYKVNDISLSLSLSFVQCHISCTTLLFLVSVRLDAQGLIIFSQQMAHVGSSDNETSNHDTQTHMAVRGQPNLSLNVSFVGSSLIALITAVMQLGIAFKREGGNLQPAGAFCPDHPVHLVRYK